jgi:PAS domain S-box-containing protein
MVDYLTVVEFSCIGRWGLSSEAEKCVVVAAFLLPQASSAGPTREVRRVLIINVFDPLSSPGVAELDHGITAGLESSPYQIELYTEDLEMTLFPDEAHQEQFREWYTRKYHDRKPNLIIAVGLEPIKFLALSHKVSFPDTPIVFCGSTEDMLGQLKLDSDFTGVWELTQPEKTLIAALHLQPGTKHVAVVGGVGAYDRYLEATARASFRKYESRFDFLYLTDLDMPALLERLKHLPDDTIVYHTAFTQDASGARFIDATQSVPMIASASKAPVFVVDDVDLGRGTAGGDVLSWASDGTVAGEMAVRVLNGEKPQDIPIAKSANVYMFDWRALKRWGLDEKNLPAGSIVLNRQPTVWESYKWYIISGISLILLEALLIGGLVWQRAERRKSEKAARASEERLRLAQQTREELLKIFVRHVPAAVAMLDRDMRYLQASERWCADFSLESSQILGRSHYEIFPDLPDGWRQIHRRALAGETLRAEEDRWDRKGVTTWLRWEIRPWQNLDGVQGGILIFTEDITHRKNAEEAILGMSRKLIEAHEQERTRIGRDLHDDVVQRLALLSIELEGIQEDVPDGASELHTRIHALQDETTQITNDVQLLSHELHSSNLEYLGIVRAAMNFCKEFGERQKVEVDFQSHDLPTALPNELSLPLFRVLQEALRNATKHSGVKRFEVRLWGSTGEIHLTVSDRGAGFDTEAAMKGAGLGLTSMRERVRLVGGEFSINSQPKGGTIMHARVPLRSVDDSMRAAG